MRMAGEGPPVSRPLPNAVRYQRALDEWMASKRVPQAAE